MGCINVKESTVVALERFGKFESLLKPGLHFYNPFLRSTREALSLRLETFDCRVETITSESLSVIIHVGIQYRIDDGRELAEMDSIVVDDGEMTSERSKKLYKAYYGMSNPIHQMQQHINSYFRTFASGHSLKELLSAQTTMQDSLLGILDKEMSPFGYKIFRCMVTDIDPPPEVKSTMNAVLSSQNKQQAMINEAEGKKQAAILAAQGECEVKELQGRGMALQKEALASGLSNALVKLGQNPKDMSCESAAALFLTSGYNDVMGQAAQGGGHSWILTSNPLGAVTMEDQLKTSFISSSQISQKQPVRK